MYSEILDGCVIEAGPDSFISEKPWAAALCRELGIGDQLIGSNDNDRKTWIVSGKRLLSLPDGLMFLVPTKILPTLSARCFPWSTKFRMAKELLHPPRPMHEDESVAAFIERHFGREMVDRLADPMLSGIYGGDTDRLSVRATLGRFVEMEEKYGSLSRAMLVANKKMKTADGRQAQAAALHVAAQWHAANGRHPGFRASTRNGCRETPVDSIQKSRQTNIP